MWRGVRSIERNTIMSKIILLAAGMAGIASLTHPAFADDHLATAVAAGGLIDGVSQLFQVNGAGKTPGEDAPGQGSPLSGMDHSTPASAVQEDKMHNGHPFKDNPAFASGKTAPSQNSQHFK